MIASLRIVRVDAVNCNSLIDFYRALFSALGAPDAHGYNINALIDSVIYGGINRIDPPYKMQIIGTEALSSELRTEIQFTIELLKQAQEQACDSNDNYPGVEFEFQNS